MVLIIGVTQCKLPDNVDPKNPTEVPIETIFTNAEVALLNQVDEINVNRNITRLIAQYHQETTYFDEARYLFIDRQIPDNYTVEFYRDALMDLKKAKELLADWSGDATERDNKIAMASILEVYAWHCVVDAFGDMPYSEALQLDQNSTPVYDDAAGIYADLLTRLDAAIGKLKAGGSFGGADVLFDGDVAAWKTFGYSLKLRLGMRLADVNSAAAKTAVEAASAHVYTEQSESAILHYVGVVPNVNAIYTAFVVDGRKDYLPTNTIVNLMNKFNDPRLSHYFTSIPFKYDTDENTGRKIDTDLEFDVATSAVLLYKGGDSIVTVDLPFKVLAEDSLNTFNYYKGAIAGLDAAQSYSNYSNFAPMFFEASFPAIISDYVETEFLLAEAAERGFSVSGTAADHYENAITASILYWGGTQDDVVAYLANPDVAYATASDNWREKIGTQKWIALYNRGIEGWAEWRRLDFPLLNVPEGMDYNDIPKRMPYPYNEVLQNEANYDAAVAKMGGVDDHRQRIFWDVN